MNRRSVWVCGVLISLTFAVGVIALCAGEISLSPSDLWQALRGTAERVPELILSKIRLPRSVAAWTAGAALGLGGALMQAVTRNRLASPEILGVNDGAMFLVISMTLFSVVPSVGNWQIATVGALGAFGLLLLFTKGLGQNGYRILVVGIGVSHLFRALNELLLSRGQIQHATEVYVWSLGSFVGRGYAAALPAFVGLLICVPPALMLRRQLNLLGLSEEVAHTLGVPVSKVKFSALALAVIVTGLGLSVGGPLAFIALASPVLLYRLNRSRDVPVIGSVLAGGFLVLAGDTLGRILLAPIELPVGIVCRILGGLFLLFLLSSSPDESE
ncbi:iron ABC transporter permease [Kiritimatiellaeota bacterium B1221]|nr:iron ABC transporter permease [Kiritimatiellaeota bacterium B1221]